MKKTAQCLLVLLSLLLVLTSCGPSATTPASASTAAAGTSAPAASDAPASGGAALPDNPYAERMTYTANVLNEPPTGNALWDAFSEKFNVDIEFIPFQYSERIEKLRIWVATDDLPDIVWIGLNETFYTEWITWMQTGLFKEFPSDLSAWPLIKERYDDPVMLGDELLTLDGKLMSMPVRRANPETNFSSDFTFIYRADWAEKLGIRKPGDVYTWEEFTDVLAQFIEKDPGGNGAGRTFGIGASQNQFPDCFGIVQSDPGPWAWEEPAFVAIDGKYEWYPSTDTYLDGLAIAKDLYDRGIIWKDNVIDSSSTMYSELYLGGQMGAIQARPMSSINKTNRDKMLEINPSLDRNLCWTPAYVSSPGQPDQYWQKLSSCFWSCIAMSARCSDEQMTRWLDYTEWLHTEEGRDFNAFGLEGKDFSRGGDDTITLNWAKNDAGQLVDPYATSRWFYRQVAMLDGIDTQRNKVTMDPADVETYQQCMDFYNTHPSMTKVQDYVQIYSTLPTKAKQGTFVQEVKAKAIDMLANGKAETLRDDWKAWVATMQPKVQPVLDELNAMPFIPKTADEMYEYVKTNGVN